MKKLVAGVTIAVLGLASGAVTAHHSLAQFDTSTAVTVKGKVLRFDMIGPHSVLHLGEQGSGGVRRWAVHGPSANTLRRRGILKDALKVGDIVEACGYVLKEGVAVTSRPAAGRVLDGELVVMADGRKVIWSDYGHHKCIGPEIDHPYHR